MLKYFRLYYNYILFRIGWRRVLPAYFINRIEVRECGESLVTLPAGIKVRQTVAVMLDAAAKHLPPGYSIEVIEGWRDEQLQAQRRKIFSTGLGRSLDKFVAKRSGHLTGGAVDVRLLWRGKSVDCGTDYLEFNNKTPTDCRYLSPEQNQHRKILFDAMISAGFVNYPMEWWHYCFGDKMYAAYQRKKYAIYNEIKS